MQRKRGSTGVELERIQQSFASEIIESVVSFVSSLSFKSLSFSCHSSSIVPRPSSSSLQLCLPVGQWRRRHLLQHLLRRTIREHGRSLLLAHLCVHRIPVSRNAGLRPWLVIGQIASFSPDGLVDAVWSDGTVWICKTEIMVSLFFSYIMSFFLSVTPVLFYNGFSPVPFFLFKSQ